VSAWIGERTALSANIDALFDAGLLTFDARGNMSSSSLSAKSARDWDCHAASFADRTAASGHIWSNIGGRGSMLSRIISNRWFEALPYG
jgi:hypothetical protein